MSAKRLRRSGRRPALKALLGECDKVGRSAPCAKGAEVNNMYVTSCLNVVSLWDPPGAGA